MNRQPRPYAILSCIIISGYGFLHVFCFHHFISDNKSDKIIDFILLLTQPHREYHCMAFVAILPE